MPQRVYGNDVVDEICRILTTSPKLQGMYDKVYKNTPKQGLKYPCAFVQQVDTIFTPNMRNRGERRYTIDVRLHQVPDYQTYESWAREVGDEIMSELSYIYLFGLKQKVRTITAQQVGKVYHIMLTYSFKVILVEEDGVLMEVLEHIERVKD